METVAAPDVPVPTAPDDEFESPTRRLTGWPARLATVLATSLSLYALYWVVGIVQPLVYRASFLLIVLVLSFLFYPGSDDPRSRTRVRALDWLLASLAVVSLVWPLVDFDNFIYRAADPTALDMTLGAACILLVLEATRRTAGWVLPITATCFILYTFYGPLLDLVGLGLIAHRGYDLSRIVGTIYMTLEGVFGVPLDVAASYIILFSIYGAVLGASGAGKFFLEWSMAAVGKSGGGAGPGRAVTVAGLLLGTVSGSGVANTVTLGSVAWPMLRRAGYKPDMGGAILSAAGIGAIICPPALGAAAFIIAEFLHITYLKVIVLAAIPALLYFFSIFLMIEADTRRAGARPVAIDTPPLWRLTRRRGYHFLAVVGIPIMLILGMSPFRAVFFSMIIAVALSFVDRGNALWPRRLLGALYTGARSVLPVASTTATAGIIVGTVTLTGLGLKISGLIVDLAGGYLFLTVLYSAFAIWMLGLAVPVTASYIIAAVMVAPAMTKVGVPDLAAHMFIFYYAVLSEVSPPTALSPFAAAAITGAKPVPTMMLTWKYTLPAFVFPFAFTLSKQGMGLLLQGPPADVLMATGTAVVGILALGAGLGGWIRATANATERTLATVGGLLLFYAGSLSDAVGLALFVIAIGLHFARTKRPIIDRARSSPSAS
ncbi:MAG TPA: TRAP transporter fused permease subunit [Vicinamibacterales bacterium]|nr:TRAP transporter fused permease subunit [Vicinamibacterales bacterium]